MKISDFTLQEYNIAEPGMPPKMGLWKQASKGAKIGIGVYGGKKHQIKLHESQPKWYNASQKIRDKEAELRGAPEEMRERLESELSTLRANKDKYDAQDAISDAYVAYKQKLISALNSPADPAMVGPIDFWKEPIASKNNEVFSVEAVPWVDSAVGFTEDSPIVFSRDLTTDQQYDIVASLADAVAKLHARGILHCDLKRGNTLIRKEGDTFAVTLIDFDAAILRSELKPGSSLDMWYHIVGGTYFAPEVLEFFVVVNERVAPMFATYDFSCVSEKWDVFSLGVTIFEYFYGEAGANILPMRSPEGEPLTEAAYGEAVAQDYVPDFPDSMSDLLFGMLNWMLAKNPADRPTVEQVRDIFRSRDISSIPSKYVRNPLWEEHRDDYELVGAEGVAIEKGMRPLYRVKRNGFTVTRKIEALVEEGLARSKKGGEVGKAPAGPADELWPEDGSGKLPPCVVRASEAGKYISGASGMRKMLSYSQLKEEGYLCTEEERATPWPCDSDLVFAPGKKRITRDLGRNRGPGHYLVGEGITAIRYTKRQLIENGYTVGTGVKFSLWASDADYLPNPEGLPKDVVSVVRYTITNHMYRLTYRDGRTENLLIGAMLSKGYVKKK